MWLRSRQPLLGIQPLLFSPLNQSVNRQFRSFAQLFKISSFSSKLFVINCDNHFRTYNILPTSIRFDSSVISIARMSSEAGPSLPQNRLAYERSPYLLQHAHNPVDWYPWCQEAFDRAEAENKPIFLSIGYSTCHWCHVMEKESFENHDVAKILKDNYIAIKLDREERPDIDKIYMGYVQKVTGSGGWPLTMFLIPSLEPMYGGTYFPLEDMHGRVGLKNLLQLIARQWKTQHNILKREAKAAINSVQSQVYTKVNATDREVPSDVSWKKCFVQLNRSFEPVYGGFTGAPKFPQPSLLSFLLHMYHLRASDYEGKRSLEMVLLTLRKIGAGGIHDHVGSGFARYAVDKHWHVPHFEKMLYDQSQLALAYIEAYLCTKDKFFHEMAEDIFKYVSRDLRHPMGAFYGAEDADSFETDTSEKKREGAFYVWKMDELRAAFPDKTVLDMFCFHFGTKPYGNVDPKIDLHNELDNRNVLCNFGSLETTAQRFNSTPEATKVTLQECLNTLFEIRNKRPRPSTDTKIVTAWNGLMIAAYAKSGFCFKNNLHVEQAIQTASFIKNHLALPDGSLLRCCYGNGDDIDQTDRAIPGLLEDYAFMIRGLMNLYECTLDAAWLEWAEKLQDVQNEKFWDNKYGSYFQSHEGDKYAIVRDKEVSTCLTVVTDQDGAEPCGNSVSAYNLVRLDSYLDRKDFRDMASQVLKGYSSHLEQIPISLPEMTSALILFHNHPHQIFIAGERGAPDTEALLDVVRNEYLPGSVLVLADDANGPSGLLYKRNKVLESIKRVRGKAAAYVCKNFACNLPVLTPRALKKCLVGKRLASRADRQSSSSDSDN